MKIHLKSIILNILFFILSLSLLNCSSSNDDDNSKLPSVAMVIFAFENFADDDDTLISATAYSIDNFDKDNWGAIGILNFLEFHLDKSLEVWTGTSETVTDRSEVFVSSFAASGLANYLNELTNLWSVKRVEPGESYYLDFTDDDGQVFTGSIASQEFVSITNYTDGDNAIEDTLTITWDESLVTGDLSVQINYTDSFSGESVSENFANISNTGEYDLDISHAEGDFTVMFYHNVEQTESEEFGPQFVLNLTQRTSLTLHH